MVAIATTAGPALAQTYKLDGTSKTAFSIGLTNKITFTNSSGTLSLTSAISTNQQITSTLSTGTAPFAITSTTKCTNLNVDQVDGFSITANANGGVGYQSSSSQLSFSAAGTAGQVLVSGGSGSPTWSTLNSTQIYVGSSSNIPAAVSMSGDVTLSNTGVATIQSGAITGSEIAASTVTAAMLANAVADAIPTATLSAGAEAGNVIQATLQLKDVQGNNQSQVEHVWWVLSDSQNGTTVTGNTVTTAYGIGSEYQQITADKKASAFTNSSGVLRLDVTYTGAGTMYLMVSVGGTVYNVALTYV